MHARSTWSASQCPEKTEWDGKGEKGRSFLFCQGKEGGGGENDAGRKKRKERREGEQPG